ncbi:Oidioi.mRNA.OKI2018_I69.chr2.g4199.t1.cds [Oikopleura dioica]|uniref:Oidioi.mRNA.OKI2018_I69.chr2.g4199.t1.cds n=1 Tax=Oikopleura dioica TaxID=34765 RepID=A0ABN7T0F1_OIKDI|nr:Oidioi.mRNA.OKI2018_I69.chr2.g4199.t1.cds [Oikopleura dioica]
MLDDIKWIRIVDRVEFNQKDQIRKRCRGTYGGTVDSEFPGRANSRALQKYSDLVDEHNLLKQSLQSATAKYKKLQRDNYALVQTSTDFMKKKEKDTATINALQNLSRELQDQNRKIKAEVIKKTKEDDAQRKHLIEKFQNSLESISKQLDENANVNETLRQRNSDLSDSLEQVIAKSEERESALMKTIDALKQQDVLLRQKIKTLMDAREMEHEKVKEYLSEKTETMDKVNQERINLQEQVKYYAARFEEFTDSLAKSNTAINGFSTEMSKMKKINERLEKAVVDWKSKHQSAQNQLIIATEKTLTQGESLKKKEDELKKKTNQVEKLEKLCRALQARHFQQIEAATGKSPKSPEKPPATTSDPTSSQESPAQSSESPPKNDDQAQSST